jgi:hypothetical protein
MSKGSGQSGGGGSSTQVVDRTLPANMQWLNDAAKATWSRGSSLGTAPYGPYPWTYDIDKSKYRNTITGDYSDTADPYFTSTVAPLTSEHNAAMDLITARALAGSPLTNSAQANLYDTIQGKYLDPESNPYLKDTYQYAADDITRNWKNSVLPQLNATASRSGAFGGSGHQLLEGESMRGLANELGRTATNLYGTNYNNERANQLKSIAMAPSMAETDYSDMSRLLGVGDIQRSYDQQLLDEMRNQWTQATGWPYQTFGTMTSALGAAAPIGLGQISSVGTTTASDPYRNNTASRIMGGATSGVGLGLMAAMAGMNPFGAAALGTLPLIGSAF